jgi:hypothetical protein
MTLDLSGYDRHECKNCLTARDVARHADLYTAAYLTTDNRALAAHLLQNAADLMLAAQTLMKLFLLDGYDPSSNPNPGLTEAQRLQVLTLASTCAYNATLFVQEAQHRRIRRAATGWDPITTPATA